MCAAFEGLRAKRLAWSIVIFAGFLSATSAATVPFVGCPSDGQTGPRPAAVGRPFPVSLPPAVAARLAYYKAEFDGGVVAPRGWHCLSLYGSNGWTTLVTPQALDAAKILAEQPAPITGPVIQVSLQNGGTSGRFGVARLIARYFPERRAFLRSVMAEGIEPADDFPSGSYATDEPVSRGPEIVRFLTPAGRQGLGTGWIVQPSSLPVHAAAAVIGPPTEPNGYIFAARLPPEQDALANPILTWAERTYANERGIR